MLCDSILTPAISTPTLGLWLWYLRHRLTQAGSNSGRLWLRMTLTPHNSDFDSGQLPTTPKDPKRLRIMLVRPSFKSWFLNFQSRIGVDSGFLPTLPISILHSNECILLAISNQTVGPLRIHLREISLWWNILFCYNLRALSTAYIDKTKHIVETRVSNEYFLWLML